MEEAVVICTALGKGSEVFDGQRGCSREEAEGYVAVGRVECCVCTGFGGCCGGICGKFVRGCCSRAFVDDITRGGLDAVGTVSRCLAYTVDGWSDSRIVVSEEEKAIPVR